MIGPMLQMAALVGMTNGFRALGRWLGPRRSGLLMGLPSTTALVLVGCGLERGTREATLAAETCLTGLVAAAALPLVFARSIGAGGGVVRSALAGVLGYFAVALGLWWLPRLGAPGCAAGAGAGLFVLCRAAGRIRLSDRDDAGPWAGGPPTAWTLASRTAVPALYFVAIRALRAVAGSGWSGRFITFPGATLAVLVATHLEAGPRSAGRLAAALPFGNLGMLAFLTAFRFGSPSLGLGWGTAVGYLAAFSALAAVEWFGLARVEPRPGPPVRKPTPRTRGARGGRSGRVRVDRASKRSRAGRSRGRRRRPVRRRGASTRAKALA